MVTVQQVFDMAIHIIDEQNETSGATVTVDTNEYKYRTISILHSVIPRLYPYSGTYKQTAKGRPAPSQLSADDYKNPDLDQAIPLDDVLSLALLPYFLAAQLVSAENTDLANWCMNIYNGHFADLRYKVPGDFERISTPYGSF
jgi:hypothetical protein